jgi:ribosome-associated heat shock protein Hsp15
MSNSSTNRIDKFLWSVRIYKTRSQAADACKNGRVIINEVAVKASRVIEAGDIFTVKKMPVIYTYRCIDIPPSRVGAKMLANFIENLTPEEELQKLDLRPGYNSGHRRRGAGRPTKRERRDIDRFKNE